MRFSEFFVQAGLVVCVLAIPAVIICECSRPPAPPTPCAWFADKPLAHTPARCVDGFHPERP